MSIRNFSSPASLKAEFEVVRRLQEKGASWDQIEQSIVRLTGCSNNGGCAFATEMIAGIRSLSTPLNNAINSERSRLSAAAIELVSSLSAGLGPAFEPLVSLFFPALLGLCARTNTVFTRRAKACIFVVIENTQSPCLLPYLTGSVNNKSASLRLIAAKGVLACLNLFKSLDDTRAHLIKDVIELTARDTRADVRKAGENILEAYKAILPDNVESFIALPPVPNKSSAVQGTTTSRPISPALSRRRPTTGRVRPVGSLHTGNISSGTHSERRSHPLSTELARDIPATRPTTSARRQNALRPSPESGPSSAQSTTRRRDVGRLLVHTNQRPQRVGSRDTTTSESRSTEHSRYRTAIRPVGSLETQKMSSVKHSERRAHPPSSDLPRDIPVVTPIAMSNKRPAARHSKFRPLESDSSSTQSNQRSTCSLAPTTKRPQRVRDKVTGQHRAHEEEPRVGAATQRVLVRPAPLPETDMVRTRVRKTRPLSVKPNALDPLPKPLISKCDPKISPIATKAELQTASSQASSTRRARSGQQAVGQKKPVSGERPVTKAPKSAGFKALMNSICGMNNPDYKPEDILLPLASQMLVPRGVGRALYLDRIRSSPWRPRRQDSRAQTSFFTSTPRTSKLSSPLSPFRIPRAKTIAHEHDPNISCFHGCEL